MKRTVLALSLVALSFLWSVTSVYAQGGPAKPDDASLVAYYMMDEGSGISLRDTSGTGNHGIIKNGPAWVTGIKGQALSFQWYNSVRYSPRYAKFAHYKRNHSRCLDCPHKSIEYAEDYR